MHGILKNPIRGPERPSHRLRTTSSENLLSVSRPSHQKRFSLSKARSLSAPVTDDCEQQETDRDDRDDGDDMVQRPALSEGSDNEQRSRPASRARQKPPGKVQFPENIEKTASFPPYLHTRQESEGGFSSGPPSIVGTDDEDSDNFNWSEDDDLADQEAKFGKHMGVKETKRKWGVLRIMSLFFTSLIGSMVLAAILVAPAIIVQFYWYDKDPTDHRKFVKDNIQAWLFWAAANIVISWYLAVIIDIVPILFRYAVSAVWGHVSESIKTKIETYISVKDTAKPAFYAASAYASWIIIFADIFDLYNVGHPTSSRAQYLHRTAQVVEFFFFLFLVWCAQRMLSHFVAFSFHRTAYKERIDSVEKALVVIEKLRQYRPKPSTPSRPGTRTPVFGGFGFPAALTDKQHSKLLTKALRNATPFSSRRNVNNGHHHDVGEDADIELEDTDRTLVNKKGKASNRYSWFDNSAESSEDGHMHRQHSDQADESDREREKDKGKVAVEKEGLQAEIEMSPMSPATGQVYTATPATPSILNPHRYPPAGSPRPSDDGNTADATLKQAAKIFKKTMLHDSRNITGLNEEKDSLQWNVSSSREAKRLARSIWQRFKAPGRSWLAPSDFYPAFPDRESAEEAFKVFDKDNNGDISKSELKQAVIKVYKERRFLARSMRDVGEALKTLDRILLFFAGVILFFIGLSVFGVNVTKSLTSMYTLAIAASFVFKNAASNAFDAIMLLFVTHPYDTGDRVMIGTENLVVKKVGLFATVFGRVDGSETYYFNSQLFSQFILNVRRSGKTFENLTMQVAWDTPLTKLDTLEKCLNDWLSTEENRWFEPSTNITLQNVGFQRYLELTIGIGHNGNWQDWNLRLARKTAFHAAVQYYCQQLGITCYQSPLPVVYANPATLTYQPSPMGDEVLSPTTEHMNTEQLKEETMQEAKEMKPTLGFLPPLADRSNRLIRARKSKHRKANMGAGNV